MKRKIIYICKNLESLVIFFPHSLFLLLGMRGSKPLGHIYLWRPENKTRKLAMIIHHFGGSFSHNVQTNLRASVSKLTGYLGHYIYLLWFYTFLYAATFLWLLLDKE